MHINQILTIYYQNARGLRTKSQEFLSNILNCNYDIICITETSLNQSFYSSEYFDTRYDVFRCDRNETITGHSVGGGVLVAVRRELCASARADLCAPPPADELFITIPLHVPAPAASTVPAPPHSTTPIFPNGPCLRVICTYIPHSSEHKQLLGDFYDRLGELQCSRPNDTYLVLGDFNVTEGEWFYDNDLGALNLHPSTDSFASLTSDFLCLTGFYQFNRIFNDNDRLLDLIFSNTHCNVTSSAYPLVKEDRPHHRALEAEISLKLPTPLKCNTHIKKCFFKGDYELIRSELSAINWESEFSDLENDVNAMVECFYSILRDIILKFIPLKIIKSNQHKYPPWYTIPLKKLTNEKRKYHKKWKTYGNTQDYNTFRTLRSRLHKMEQECYRGYLDYSEAKIKQNPKFFWSFVKSKTASGDMPDKMIFEGIELSNGKEICEAFNNYFHSVFIDSNNTNSGPNDLSPRVHIGGIDISSINLEDSVVLRHLQLVNTNKGAGWDEIHPIFISKCATEILIPVCMIYRASVSSGIFPDIWKKALITPIPKNNKKDQICQYRPISKLSVLGKILEKIVTDQLS